MIDPQRPDYMNTPASPLRPLYGYQPADPDAPPAVSLITPFFNTGLVFHETAQSVFRQSLQQWEWIIVDDCSTDPASLSMLEEYRGRDPRIRILRADRHVGLPSARNMGVAAARADFIALLDGDDLLEPTALEKLRWFLECRPELAFARGHAVGFGAQSYLWYEGFHSRDKFLETNCVPITAMIRRQVYLDAGGMDERIQGGMEDWEFWLRCADRGFWGDTLPEFLDWYRRRADHGDRWENLAGPERMRSFRIALMEKYPSLFRNGVPKLKPVDSPAYPVLKTGLPFENRLAHWRNVKRLLMIVPHFEIGGADKFNLDLIGRLQADHGYQVTVAATLPGKHPWRRCFEELTPDVFTLSTFLPPADYPRFIEYLIKSRGCDAVLISNSQLGYQLLPFLRTGCSGPVFADYVHMEQEEWKSGGYPRYSLNYAPFLDLTVAASTHLKNWMVRNGGDPDRIHVCTINIDPAVWDRTRYNAADIRAKYGIRSGTPVTAYAARLCDQKRPDVLAQVVKDLKQRGAEFVCLVAGDGPYRDFLENFVKTNNLEELKILGAKPNEEVREILAIADVYFMPSQMEGIALAIYEAMAMGAVPVSADVGGQSELVTSDCGILIKPGLGEIPAYTQALLNLLGDPARRNAMAVQARRRICERFTLREMGTRMASLLTKPPEAPPFDVASAFQSWRGGLATEIVEHQRVEFLCEDLWNRGAVAVSPAANEEYVAMLALAGRLGRGNLLVLPQLLRSSGIGLRGALRTLALVLSPRHPVRQARNLALCAKALSNPAARGRLLATFDAEFYRSQYPDVSRSKVIPLLHYCLAGYTENRQPSRQFDAVAIYRQNPELARRGINPLLAMAVDRNSTPEGR
jgi:glycosyltransferase involved in cell wall biosynthesis/GT2 family glycosyltransferase